MPSFKGNERPSSEACRRPSDPSATSGLCSSLGKRGRTSRQSFCVDPCLPVESSHGRPKINRLLHPRLNGNPKAWLTSPAAWRKRLSGARCSPSGLKPRRLLPEPVLKVPRNSAFRKKPKPAGFAHAWRRLNPTRLKSGSETVSCWKLQHVRRLRPRRTGCACGRLQRKQQRRRRPLTASSEVFASSTALTANLPAISARSFAIIAEISRTSAPSSSSSGSPRVSSTARHFALARQKSSPFCRIKATTSERLLPISPAPSVVRIRERKHWTPSSSSARVRPRVTPLRSFLLSHPIPLPVTSYPLPRKIDGCDGCRPTAAVSQTSLGPESPDLGCHVAHSSAQLSRTWTIGLASSTSLPQSCSRRLRTAPWRRVPEGGRTNSLGTGSLWLTGSASVLERLDGSETERTLDYDSPVIGTLSDLGGKSDKGPNRVNANAHVEILAGYTGANLLDEDGIRTSFSQMTSRSSLLRKSSVRFSAMQGAS